MNRSIPPRIRSLLAAAAGAFAAAVAMFPGSAGAAGPIHSNIALSGDVPLCGLTVSQSGRLVDNFFPVLDSAGNIVSYKDVYSLAVRFTYAGKAIDLQQTGQQLVRFVNNPDGSQTITVTYVGLPERWSWPGGSTITRDAGILTEVLVISADGVVEADTVVREMGPHPEADSGFALACQIVLGALT